jgi:signal transduction histidine kinase
MEFKSDPFLVKILLKNIIENAVKFKDDRKNLCYIRVTIKCDDGKTRISIADNGLGIPVSQVNKVFDMFVVASLNSKGFGLGLYEAKLITRKLNGNIELVCPGGETEFIVTL